MEEYQALKREIRRLWKFRNVEIVPVVIGALGSVSTEFDRWTGKLAITCNIGVIVIVIVIVIIKLALMKIIIKTILIIVVIITNSPFKAGDLSTGSSTDICQNLYLVQRHCSSTVGACFIVHQNSNWKAV